LKNQCGAIKKETITGQGHVSGVASFAQGEVLKVAGSAVPIECNSPFEIPIEEQKSIDFCPKSGDPECNSNVLCVRYQINGGNGTCCEPIDPSFCCAFAKPHRDCRAAKSDDIICPSKQGRFHPCCSGIERNKPKVHVYAIEPWAN